MKRVIYIWWIISIAFICTTGCAEDPKGYEAPAFNCAKEGGTCTSTPVSICDPGFEPFTENDPQLTDCNGHCCVEEEVENTCSPNESYNCVPGGCPSPWLRVEGDLNCGTERSDPRACCAYRPS